MRRFVAIALTLVTASCTTGIEMESVDYGYLLHDGNSKVWIVNKVMMDNAIVSPSQTIDKHLLIFFESHTAHYIPFKDFGRKDPDRGDFRLDSGERKLNINFGNNDNWDFTIGYLTEDSILLEPTPESDMQRSIQLKPLPED